MPVIKSITRKTKSWGQLLAYMLRDKSKSDSFVLKQHIEGTTIPAWEKAFSANEANRLYNRSNNVMLYHEVVSWSVKDIKQMSDEKLKDLASKYLEFRNENALAIAVPHYNKTHYHVHFCISGVEIDTGKSLRISKEAFKEVKRRLEQYQLEKYPELSKSVIDHATPSKSRLKQRENELIKRTHKPSERQRTKEQLEECYKNALSSQDFMRRVSEAGMQVYERNGKVTGIDGTRNMRFSTLGFDQDKLIELDTRLSLRDELQEIRCMSDRYDRAKELEDRFAPEAVEDEAVAAEGQGKEGVEKEDDKNLDRTDDRDFDIEL